MTLMRRHRSAITGRYVSEEEAQRHPDITTSETRDVQWPANEPEADGRDTRKVATAEPSDDSAG